ncbi:MAG TPA: HAMP domain-containing sensor histidine kinase [Bryobacteraceae bacterium]|nr:HAMP domain-containing sensor histidine kinase [Bryobacteraceae bacterium]
MRSGLADAVICLNHDGSVAYPSPRIRIGADPTARRPDWLEARTLEYRADITGAAAAYRKIAEAENGPSLKARALQAEVRCLLRIGQTNKAIQIIKEQLTKGPAAGGTDLQGRLISADADLLALHLQKPSAPGYMDIARSLRNRITDYSGPLPPSSQRLFLMSELRALRLGPEFDTSPMYNAERLAADFLTTGILRPHDRALEVSTVPGIWTMASASGQLIALFRSETLIASFRHVLNERMSSSRVASFSVLPPGSRSDAVETIAAGPMMPGWKIALSLDEGTSFQDVVRRQTISYLWAALLAIATLTVAGIVSGRVLGRQMRLARLKTDLVAAVSHELKTPLSSIQLLADALLEEDRFEPAKTREYLDLIARENRRLSCLVENFLSFSRMERNRYTFEFAETNVAEIVRDAVEAVTRRFNSIECRPEVNVSPGMPAVRADRDALVSVLVNLLENAYKFTREKKQISLQAFCEGNRVSFAVSDNGIGIPLREQKKIFRSFYQVDRRLSRQAGGCGLGLSIVEFIVKEHGGYVRVKSRPGAGSTFVISLPSLISPEGTAA